MSEKFISLKLSWSNKKDMTPISKNNCLCVEGPKRYADGATQEWKMFNNCAQTFRKTLIQDFRDEDRLKAKLPIDEKQYQEKWLMRIPNMQLLIAKGSRWIVKESKIKQKKVSNKVARKIQHISYPCIRDEQEYEDKNYKDLDPCQWLAYQKSLENKECESQESSSIDKSSSLHLFSEGQNAPNACDFSQNSSSQEGEETWPLMMIDQPYKKFLKDMPLNAIEDL